MHGRTIPSRIPFAFAHGYDRRIAIRTYVKTVLAGFLDSKREIGRINLVRFAAVELAHAQVERSLMQLDLDDVVADVRKSDARLVVHAQDAAANVQFCA
jgi:hypothetical protein